MSLLLLSASTVSSIPLKASAEECKKYDFRTLFYDDYYPGTIWALPGQSKEISWTIESQVINDESVERNFNSQEKEWAKLAISSWDERLDTISFRQISGANADLAIGYVALISAANQPGATGYWNAWWTNNIRNRATIKLKVSSAFLQTREGFIHALQHEIGNVLGLGDIKPSDDFESTQEDPWQKPFGITPLGDFDSGMIRQLYGESTCPSTWKSQSPSPAPTVTVTATPSPAPTVTVTATPSPAPTVTVTATPSPAPTVTVTATPSPAPTVQRNKTITCYKGKLIKKVSGKSPKCPTGFKKK